MELRRVQNTPLSPFHPSKTRMLHGSHHHLLF
ncbi:hypothetical protein RRG08_025032 [Elysia crispata]|uniref:Uncharacterized protein n=1 Tax=Elysia crispata TaxID=231223 RepID=A0AAE1ANX8_9GAST|nr:hypothetical protein RRG08_025032 [Elysia crispata]